MEVNDIRPDNLMKESKRLRLKDLEDLLKNESRFIKVPCPACQLNDYSFLFRKEGFNFVGCNKCETIFINPRPTFDMFINFYETGEYLKYWNEFIFPVSEEFRRRSIFIPRAKKVFELVVKHKCKNRIMLDVGAGFGTFCEEIEKLNLFDKVIAVEPSADLAKTCVLKDLNVIQKPVEKVEMDDEVDVITNFELIEHLFSPKDFLFSCNKILKKDGLLILTTPNIKGFDMLVLGEKSDGIVAPVHINYFNIDSLSLLLKSCGFKVLEVLTPGKLDAKIVRDKIINKELDVDKNPFFMYLFLEKWDDLGNSFQKFLSDNLLSSHLWIVAKKD
ncbi:class I SAM-dependent methyltransferase [Candidatus Babeliales bacterium]|nr:class I SAM-dependent methyltransferase [Candidatus Babeliales bacterium]